MKNENVISWNLPNFITLMLMVALLWAITGIASHLIRGKMTPNQGVMPEKTSGNLRVVS